VVAIIGDIAGASIKAKAKLGEAAPRPELEALSERVKVLEARLDERDQAQRKLEEDLRFMSRLLEDKSRAT